MVLDDDMDMNPDNASEGLHLLGSESTYKTWEQMISSCRDKNIHSSREEGLGRLVNEEWNTYEGFLADVGIDPPQSQYFIELIDPKLGYSKDNCRWAMPPSQQGMGGADNN